MPALTPTDAKFLRMAYEEALAGFNEGGCPIGSVLGSQAARSGGILGATSDSLPFTGLGLLGVVLLAAIALGTGVALRRSSRT